MRRHHGPFGPWTVSYPLAADAAGRRGIGLGTAVGLLNGIWAATAVLGPLGAGLATSTSALAQPSG